MQIPVQVTFHGMPASAALDTAIRQYAGKFDRFHPHLISCRAVVEQVARHKRQGKEYVVRLDLKVSGAEIAVSREHSEDAFVAVREAFDAARRRLEDHARRRQGARLRRKAGRAA
jgi:ribosome-associated translation inhibitor RaiA